MPQYLLHRIQVWAALGPTRKPRGETIDADTTAVRFDAGGGSGELALRMVACGYRVWLLDNAPAMLDQAAQAARSLPAGARDRLVPRLMAVEDAPRAFAPFSFDAITCHTLIEYLAEPRAVRRRLISRGDDDGRPHWTAVCRTSESPPSRREAGFTQRLGPGRDRGPVA